jgi:hypothetical protein
MKKLTDEGRGREIDELDDRIRRMTEKNQTIDKYGRSKAYYAAKVQELLAFMDCNQSRNK